MIGKKQRYNHNLERINKGLAYFDNPLILQAEKEKHIESFQRLIKEQGQLAKELGIKPGDREMLLGFEAAFKKEVA